MNIDKYKLTIIEYFKTKPVLRAYFFGSILTKDFNDKSDIDILVDLDYKNGGDDFFTYLQMQDDLTKLVNKKVDLVSSNGISRYVAPIIENSKLMIYERER